MNFCIIGGDLRSFFLAKTLSKELPSRELDSLLSSGEQISSAKLSILLNSMRI